MDTLTLTPKHRNIIYGFLATLLIIKLLMMWQTPLLDPSESRYAEMARKMVETGDWITPQFDYDVPFWGKPPLSTWASAVGIAALGSNIFAARLPVLFISLGILWLLHAWIRETRNADTALITTVILASTPIFNYLTGTVMTDICLLATTTLTMVAFHRSIFLKHKNKLWPYIFFISVGLGLLAKGPAATVLAALPIFAYVLLTNSWKTIWNRLPWFSGSLLTIIIALPWYIIAESKTPGFINYFIIGEHFNRFLVSGWKGDLYGSAHQEPYGYIWIFWTLTAFPWSLYLIAKSITHFKNRAPSTEQPNTLLYLACWTLAPLIFFTFARNIIATYVLTGIPALPFLLTELKRQTKSKTTNQQTSHRTFLITLSSLTALFTTCWILTSYFQDQAPKSSQNQIVSSFQKLSTPDAAIVYWKRRVQSGEFYANGRAKHTHSESDIENLLHNNTQDFVVIYKDKNLPLPLRDKFETVTKSKKFTLLREIPHS